MSSIVYYYSLTGRCEMLSAKIAALMQCDTERIVEKKKRLSRGFLRFLNGASALRGQPTDIAPLVSEPGHFDTIVVVTPFWADSPTPAVRGFVRKYHEALRGKRIGLVVTNLGTDPAAAFSKYEKLFGQSLTKQSFTKAKGEWDTPREDELVEQFVNAMGSAVV